VLVLILLYDFQLSKSYRARYLDDHSEEPGPELVCSVCEAKAHFLAGPHKLMDAEVDNHPRGITPPLYDMDFQNLCPVRKMF